MGILDDLIASVADAQDFSARLAPKRIGASVGNSKDLSRIVALPRRAAPDLEEIAGAYTSRMGRPNASCRCGVLGAGVCVRSLFGIQGWALSEIERCRGLLGPIGVGHGKTLVDCLAPMVLPGCKVAVLLIPPNLKSQFIETDWVRYGQHFTLPNLAGGRVFYPGRPVLHVVTYSELSGARSTDLLKKISPDLIVADEAHNLRNRTAARTKRFLRHFADNPNCRFIGLSGTITNRSLKDYAHLAELALRDGSPLPNHWPTVEEWASAIDPSDFPAPVGALTKLCTEGETDVRKAFRRRLVSTPGVVATEESALGTSLVLLERKPGPLPTLVTDALRDLRGSWARPDGEELVDAMSVSRCARELAAGFYYRWRFPRGETVAQIDVWLERRKEWHKELRERLKRATEHMDSPLLCAKAAIRHYASYEGDLPVWRAETWPGWREVRDTVQPETEAVWLSDYLVEDARAWAEKEGPGIVWYDSDAFGRKLANHLPLFGPGDIASRTILVESGKRSIVASIRAHGTGKNLQAFSRQLVSQPPADGGIFEQLLGRTHRLGQNADEVSAHVYVHTDEYREAFDRALMKARYIADTTGNPQKLLYASRSF